VRAAVALRNELRESAMRGSVPTPADYVFILGSGAALDTKSCTTPIYPRDLETAMNKDQIKGQIKQVKGSIKETTGKILDDKTMATKGKIQKKLGKVQEGYGDFKEDVKNES
jgi:uncharacterized protein YjbJ (UPF0337 family)